MTHSTYSSRWQPLSLLFTLLLASSLVEAQEATQPTPSTASQWASQEEPKAPHFNVFEFEIEGNSVLPTTMVEHAVTPFLGPDKTIADVEAARAALEKVYQDAGYLTVFVDLPEQKVQEGVVKLHVLEGKISRLKVTGSRYYDQGYIRERVTELSPGRVPNFNVAQIQLADLNRTEDRRVQPVMRPGPEPGTVEAELKVTDRLPVDFSIELNNRQVQFTKPWRLQATAHYNNLFQADHSLGITAITTPQDTSQSKVLALTYNIPLPQGDAWMASLVVSDSFVEPLGSTNVVGKGFTVGAKRMWALPSSASMTHALSAGVDYKDTKERINSGADGSTLSSPLRYVPFNVGYNATVQSGDATTTVGLGMVFALRSISRRQVDCFGETDQFQCKREDGDGSFAAFTTNITHTQPLGKWATARLRLGAQFADQPLVGAEQFAIGGADSVRGYMEAEALGDSGAYAGVELAGPNWGHGKDGSWLASLSELQGYGFVEGGQVYIKNPGVGEAQRRLLGVGMGLKLRAGKTTLANVDVGWPLKKTDASPARHPRVHARFGLDF